MSSHTQIICLLGLPSSGKSQIATKLSHDFKYKYFDVGDLIEKYDSVKP